MGTIASADGESKGRGTSHLLTRALVCVLGLTAIAWGCFFLPLFWRQASPNLVASEVLQGRTFKEQALSLEISKLEANGPSSFCNPLTLHTVMILRLGIATDAIKATDHSFFDSAYAPLYDATRTALTCAPADSFAWLILFWLDAAKHGLQPNNLNYLRLSYALSPNEEWIAFWRNRLALAVFPQLPADLADDAINEFIKLVDTGRLYQETAALFARTSPMVQQRIVMRLATAGPIQREAFAKALRDDGVDVDIPGVAKPTRPWQ
jgi:hypothetical protein